MSAKLEDVSYDLKLLRQMQVSDLDELMIGELAAYPFPWTRSNFEDCLFNKSYSCWVFEQDENLYGHVVISIVFKEAHILNICLYPKYQNIGWGRKILTEAELIAKNNGAEMCFLEVRPSNHAGVHLYQSEEYNEIGLRKNYYPNVDGREDAIVMAKTLLINTI